MKVISFMLYFFLCSCMSNEIDHSSKAEQQVNITLNSTAKILQQKYGVVPSGEGATMPGGPIKELFLSFDTIKQCDKEDLRFLLIKFANELVSQVNSNKIIQDYLFEKPFKIENVQIIIYNLDKDGREANDPLIATAEISCGVLIYRTIVRDGVIKFKSEFIETYEEALKLCKDSEK